MDSLEQSLLLALEGYVPRHILDVDVSAASIVSRYEPLARTLIDAGFANADTICDTLEAQCYELAALEDDGLAGRIRYLTAVAIVAAVLKGQREVEGSDRWAYLRTVHAIAESRRVGSTYDLSNASAALYFLPGRRAPAPSLGTWIWINLAPADASRHVRWVASTLRFRDVFGREALDAVDRIVLDVERARRASGRPADTEAAAPQVGCTCDDARRIAEAYIAENPGRVGGSGIHAVHSLDEIGSAAPNLYNVRLDDCWIAYVEQTGSRLRSADVVVVSKATGAVRYAGSAHDEG